MRLTAMVGLVALLFGCFSEGSGRNKNNGNGNNGESCTPSDEVCDGVDNNCDGDVDEGFDVGGACEVGVGACAASGSFVCDAGAAVCDAQPAAPGDELCGDSIDNNCDGEVDEGFETLGDPCNVGLGVCQSVGELHCTGDKLALECLGEAGAAPEVTEVTCDDLDNDCDGDVDEGCDDDEDGYCDADMVREGAPAVCPNEPADCDDEDADVYPGAPGRCDGKDTNCDGEADNMLSTGQSFEVNLMVHASAGAETSPIVAIGSDDGFCIAMDNRLSNPGTVRLTRAAFNGVVTNIGELFSGAAPHSVVDIAYDRISCIAAVRVDRGANLWDLGLYAWGPGEVQGTQIFNDVLPGTIPHLPNSWDASIHVSNTTIAIVYGAEFPDTRSKYTTLPIGFNGSTARGAIQDAGIVGSNYTAGPSPSPAFDFLTSSFFVQTQLFSAAFGSDGVAQDPLDVSGSVREVAFGETGGDVYFAMHRAGSRTLDVRLIDSNLTYANAGTLTYDPGDVESQEYFVRHPFADGPAGTSWIVEPYGDRVYTMEKDGMGGLDFEEVQTPFDQILGLSAVGDSMLVLALVSAGTSVNDPAMMVMDEYTCH